MRIFSLGKIVFDSSTLKNDVIKKTIIYLLFGLILGSSCTKNDILESNNIIVKQDSGTVLLEGGAIDESTTGLKKPNLRMLYCEWGWLWENGGLVWGIEWCDCYIVTGNCLPDVIITEKGMAAYESFKTHYTNGTLSKFFATDEYKRIFSGLDDLGVVEELVNGDIILYLFHDNVKGKDFYFGLPTGFKFSTNDTSWMSKTKCVLVVNEDL